MGYSELNPDFSGHNMIITIHWPPFWKSFQFYTFLKIHCYSDVIPHYHFLKGSAANVVYIQSVSCMFSGSTKIQIIMIRIGCNIILANEFSYFWWINY